MRLAAVLVALGLVLVTFGVLVQDPPGDPMGGGSLSQVATDRFSSETTTPTKPWALVGLWAGASPKIVEIGLTSFAGPGALAIRGAWDRSGGAPLLE